MRNLYSIHALNAAFLHLRRSRDCHIHQIYMVQQLDLLPLIFYITLNFYFYFQSFSISNLEEFKKDFQELFIISQVLLWIDYITWHHAESYWRQRKVGRLGWGCEFRFSWFFRLKSIKKIGKVYWKCKSLWSYQFP